MHGKCNLIYEAAYHFPASVIVVLRKTRGAHLHCAILLEEEKKQVITKQQDGKQEKRKRENKMKS